MAATRLMLIRIAVAGTMAATRLMSIRMLTRRVASCSLAEDCAYPSRPAAPRTEPSPAIATRAMR
jgi:hypothetical protein